MKWSHPDRYVYAEHSRGECAVGIVWLAVASLASVLLEVVYLSFWVSVPGGHRVPVPYMILVALWFNWVLARTALLWTKSKVVAGIPLGVWVCGYMILTFSVSFTGDMLVPPSLRAMMLLFAGIAGGMIPLVSSATSGLTHGNASR